MMKYIKIIFKNQKIFNQQNINKYLNNSKININNIQNDYKFIEFFNLIVIFIYNSLIANYNIYKYINYIINVFLHNNK